MDSAQVFEVHFPAWAESIAEATIDALAAQEDSLSLDGYDFGRADASAGTAASTHPRIYVSETVLSFQGPRTCAYILFFFWIMSAIMATIAIWIAAIERVITVMSMTRPWVTRL